MTSSYSSRAEKERLIEEFIRLCEIPSPSGSEELVGKYVTEELERLGLKVKEDDAAAKCGAGCGNIHSYIRGKVDRSVLLCAHIDTVPVSGEIDVVRNGDFLENRNRAILGADDKAAVAILLALAKKYTDVQPPIGIELLFTVREEVGLAGAKAFDIGALKSQFGFVFDHPSPIGELMVEAPTHQRITARFTGVSAHAGICPEEGKSAVVAAAKAIESMQLGRIDERSTANVGAVKGGTAVNVVPESCGVLAEVRSLDHEKAVEMAQGIIDACTWAAGACDVDVNTKVEEEFHAFSLSRGSRSVKAAATALADLGIKADYIASGGGSDANAFQAKGFDCLNVANGTEAVHTADERVSVESLETMLDLGHAIVARSANM